MMMMRSLRRAVSNTPASTPSSSSSSSCSASSFSRLLPSYPINSRSLSSTTRLNHKSSINSPITVDPFARNVARRRILLQCHHFSSRSNDSVVTQATSHKDEDEQALKAQRDADEEDLQAAEAADEAAAEAKQRIKGSHRPTDSSVSRFEHRTLGENLAHYCQQGRHLDVLKMIRAATKVDIFEHDEGTSKIEHDDVQRLRKIGMPSAHAKKAHNSKLTDLVCLAVLEATVNRIPHRAIEVFSNLSHVMLGPLHPLLINLVLQSFCTRKYWMRKAMLSHYGILQRRIEATATTTQPSSSPISSSSTLTPSQLRHHGTVSSTNAFEAADPANSSIAANFKVSKEDLDFIPSSQLLFNNERGKQYYPSFIWRDVGLLLGVLKRAEIPPDRYTFFLVALLGFHLNLPKKGFYFFQRLIYLDRSAPRALSSLQQQHVADSKLCGIRLINQKLCADMYRHLYVLNAYKEIEFLFDFMKSEHLEPQGYMREWFERWNLWRTILGSDKDKQSKAVASYHRTQETKMTSQRGFALDEQESKLLMERIQRQVQDGVFEIESQLKATSNLPTAQVIESQLQEKLPKAKVAAPRAVNKALRAKHPSTSVGRRVSHVAAVLAA